MARSPPLLAAAAAAIAVMAVAVLPPSASAFAPLLRPLPSTRATRASSRPLLMSSSPSDSTDDDLYLEYDSPAKDRLESVKSELVSLCNGSSSPSAGDVKAKALRLEEMGEQCGMGQASSLSGLMAGEWELLYSPEDVTRSSPFFWAFRRAFPDNSDQIFGITDAIPAPIKEVGPATQEIELEMNSGGYGASGSLVSRVKVATLGGLATSVMTTRTKVLSVEGLDGLRLKIETTKPEDSTVLQKLGPIGEMINESAPPFPSGEALERARPGSSEVTMKTTYCDEGLRVTYYENEDKPFVWKRKGFGSAGSFSI